MRKKPFVIKTFESTSVPKLDTNLDILFKNKPESVNFTDCGTKYIKSYQEIEHGHTRYVDVLTTGTSSTNTVVSFATRYSDVLNVQLTTVGSSFTVNLVSFTGSEMLVQIDVTATIDNGAYPFFWQVVGSLE